MPRRSSGRQEWTFEIWRARLRSVGESAELRRGFDEPLRQSIAIVIHASDGEWRARRDSNAGPPA
jgi:hypothetical protein